MDRPMSRPATALLIFALAWLVAGCGFSSDRSQAAERYLRGADATLAGRPIVEASCGERGDGDVECEVRDSDGQRGTCEGNLRDGQATARSLTCTTK